MELREFEDRNGKSPFSAWFEKLDAVAAAKVTIALTRLGQGNVSNLKSVGSGVPSNFGSISDPAIGFISQGKVRR